MPYAGAPQVNQEDEEPSQGNDSKGKQVEQPGERRETQELYDWVDKLLPVCVILQIKYGQNKQIICGLLSGLA